MTLTKTCDIIRTLSNQRSDDDHQDSQHGEQPVTTFRSITLNVREGVEIELDEGNRGANLYI